MHWAKRRVGPLGIAALTFAWFLFLQLTHLVTTRNFVVRAFENLAFLFFRQGEHILIALLVFLLTLGLHTLRSRVSQVAAQRLRGFEFGFWIIFFLVSWAHYITFRTVGAYLDPSWMENAAGQSVSVSASIIDTFAWIDLFILLMYVLACRVLHALLFSTDKVLRWAHEAAFGRAGAWALLALWTLLSTLAVLQRPLPARNQNPWVALTRSTPILPRPPPPEPIPYDPKVYTTTRVPPRAAKSEAPETRKLRLSFGQKVRQAEANHILIVFESVGGKQLFPPEVTSMPNLRRTSIVAPRTRPFFPRYIRCFRAPPARMSP